MRDPQNMLNYEIRTKAYLRDLHAKLDDLTEDDIEQAKFHLPWVKKAFTELFRNRAREKAIAKTTSKIDGNIVDVTSPDPEGQLVLWTDDTTYLVVGSASIDIRTGRYLFLPDSGGFFHENVFSRTIDPKILSRGQPKGRSTLNGYKALCSEVRIRECPANAPVIDLTGNSGPTTRLAGFGVRFS